jgi:uncharacterized protein involved in type VI secretion and phage assembly
MPNQVALISQFYIKIDGADIPQGIMDNIIYIEVDDSLNQPDMFIIQMRDPKMDWTDSSTLKVGKKVEISVRGDNGRIKLMSGEITSKETSFRPGIGAVVAIRGYDQAHRLNRGRQTRSFIQVTDSDIATKIARELKLKMQIDSTREVYKYVLQDNQTNLEFLQNRAEHIGFRLFVEDNTLFFQSKPVNGGQPPVLEMGVNLVEFNARLTTSQQSSEIEVRAWDPDSKREIIGRANRAQDVPQIGEMRQGGQIAESAFGNAGKQVIVDRNVATQAEADALAQSLCEEMAGNFIQVDGVCTGNPAVMAGTMAELKGLSKEFSGRYRIAHATHRYDIKGYVTRFTVSGRHDNTLIELVGRQDGRDGSHGVVTAIVTNNHDPDGLGRVKIKFPWLSGNTESNWARIVTPMGGKERGMFFLPEVNDEVLVGFEHGDMNRPYIIGALWNGLDKPPETNANDKNNIRKIRSRSGHEIIFDDNSTEKKEKLEIHTKAGHRIVLDDCGGQEKIEIRDKSGNIIKMDSVQNEITVESNKQISMKSRIIEIDAEMMTLKADATLTIQGAMVKIN